MLVEVLRGEWLESRHRGAVVAVDKDGRRLLQIGDVDALVFPRSAIKPVQAIPLVTTGAADHWQMSERELALACASHNAEPVHIEVLQQWMQRVALTPDHLECGRSLPLHQPAAEQLLRSGVEAGRQHHNCSGKHTGMLSLAAFRGDSLAGYSDYRHATQRSWMQVLAQLIQVQVDELPWDLDGCGLPALAMPLSELALAYLRFVQPDRLDSPTVMAMQRITSAMRAHPEMVAGSDRCCTAVMAACDDLVVKTGAEGVFAALSLNRGIAIALKIDDGASRAAEVALGAALDQLGLLGDSQRQRLAGVFFPQLKNSQQRVIGSVRPAADWHA